MTDSSDCARERPGGRATLEFRATHAPAVRALRERRVGLVGNLRAGMLMTGAALALTAMPVHAQAPGAIAAEITITRASLDRFEIDYRFETPVSVLELGPPVAGYRTDSWTVATSGVRLVEHDGIEMLVASDSARAHLRVAVERHVPFSHDHYVPMVPFSDGGIALFLGYFTGVVRIGEARRELDPQFRFVPLPGERVDTPPPHRADAFVYFGTQEPAASGRVRLILDRSIPAWLHHELVRTIEATVDVLSDAVVPLRGSPLILAGAQDFDRHDGGSLKGGVVGGRLVILLRGRAFAEPSPAKIAIVQRLVAHEVAHLFQLETVPSGAYDFAEPWLHEGAAEAMAILALGAAGLWGPAQVDRYAAAARATCRDALAGRPLADAVRAGQGSVIYPCGLDLFWSAEGGPVAEWAAHAAAANARSSDRSR